MGDELGDAGPFASTGELGQLTVAVSRGWKAKSQAMRGGLRGAEASGRASHLLQRTERRGPHAPEGCLQVRRQKEQFPESSGRGHLSSVLIGNEQTRGPIQVQRESHLQRLRTPCDPQMTHGPPRQMASAAAPPRTDLFSLPTQSMLRAMAEPPSWDGHGQALMGRRRWELGHRAERGRGIWGLRCRDRVAVCAVSLGGGAYENIR